MNHVGRPRKNVKKSIMESMDASTLLSIINQDVHLPSPAWSKLSTSDKCKFFKTQDISGILRVTRCLSVNAIGEWTIQVHNLEVSKDLFTDIPQHIEKNLVQLVLDILEKAKLCPGHPDDCFLEFIKSCRNNVLKTVSNEILAELDTFEPVCLKKQTYTMTVRPKQCHLIIRSEKSVKCSACVQACSAIR